MKKSRKLKTSKKVAGKKVKKRPAANRNQRLTKMGNELKSQISDAKIVSSRAMGYKTAVSDSLLKCAKPLLDEINDISNITNAHRKELLEKIVLHTVFCWNLSFLPYDKAKTKYLEMMMPIINNNATQNTRDDGIGMFQFVYDRRHELFPNETRIIAKSDIQFDKMNGIDLSVASVDIKEHPDLLEDYFTKMSI